MLFCTHRQKTMKWWKKRGPCIPTNEERHKTMPIKYGFKTFSRTFQNHKMQLLNSRLLKTVQNMRNHKPSAPLKLWPNGSTQICLLLLFFFKPSVSMFPREFKNWKYKMKVGTTINLCDQRPVPHHRQTVMQQNGVGTLHQNWNSLKKKTQLSGLARNVGDPPAEVA